MKKSFLLLIFSISAFFAFSQNPLTVVDSTAYNNCDSSQVFLLNITQPQSPPLYYQWVFDGDALNVGTSQNPYEIWVSNLNYNEVTLNAFTNPNYMTGSLVYTTNHYITIDTCSNAINSIDINYSIINPLNCSSAMMSFQAIPNGGTGPYTYFWTHISNNGGFTNYTTQYPNIFVDNNDFVEVTVTDANGNSLSYGEPVFIGANLTPSITYNVVSSNCNTTEIEFFGAVNEPNALYEWNIMYNNTNIINSNQNFTMSFPANSQFVVANLTVTTPSGCFGTAVQTLPITNAGNTAFYSYVDLSTSPCSANSCMYEATLSSSGTAPFVYTFNNIIQTTPVFSNLCQGAYTGQIEDANGCIADVFFQIADSSSLFAQEFSYFANCSQNPGSTSYIGINTDSLNVVTWSDGYVGSTYINPTPGSYNYIVSDPISGCSVSGTMIVPASNCYNISGNVYVDLDGDCIFNNNDYALSSVWVDLADANGTWLWIYDYTDANGNFSINAPAGTYYFDVNGYNTNGFTQNCPASGFTVTLDANNPNAVVNFFLTPPAPSQDLSVSLYSITTFTPGFPYWASAHYCNDGTIPMSGTVVMNYDANLTYIFGSSANAVNDAVNHTLTWTFTNLMPGHCVYLGPDFTTSTSAVLGTTMNNTIVINPISGDVTPANNVAYVIDTVVGSWDPNDKAVYPNGNITPEIKDHSYTIRFQNEGTAPAVLVVVRDDLDNNLDLQTLRNVSSTHNFVLTVENTDELVFTFNNIMLPAKQDDEPGSMGSINFTISQKENLPLGTVINNTAEIFFDFNEPIVTNTTENIIVAKTTGINNLELLNTVKVYPNPTNGMLNITSVEDANIEAINVFDVLGQKVFEAEGLNSKTAMLNLSKLIDGIYLIEIKTENGNLMKKVTISKK